ncbi:MAG: DnaJ domain-containing protein [Desulfosudaceae bacterium]
MMTPEPSQKIVHACRLLFTDPHLVDHRFLHNMAEEDLKSAFRKKALQTHPDRFRALGRSHEELSQLFQEVFAAYETVQEFLARRHTPASSRGRHPAEGEKTAAAAAGRPAPADHYYRGGLPGRELRLGDFSTIRGASPGGP